MALFEIQNLSFHYPNRTRFELNETHLCVEKGDLLGLLGPNGAGKSTLLKLMVGLLTPKSGDVLWEGRSLRSVPLRQRARNIALFPSRSSFPFPLTVWEIVEMGRRPCVGRFGPFQKKDRQICERALSCDALEFKDRSYEELSGGERQRVLLASALAQTPQVLLLDEPRLSLDLSHQILLFEIIQRLHREEFLTVVVATHELNMAGRFLNRLVLMKEGKVMAQGTPSQVLTVSGIKSLLDVEVEKLSHGEEFPYFVPKKNHSVTV